MLTLRAVLGTPALSAAEPEVLTASDQLDRAVRWVHVSELLDVRDLLSGGELILSTGLALAAGGETQVRYVDDLAEAGACGLVIELSDRLSSVPAPVVEAARRRGFPLVALRRRVRFVDVTEEVHRVIVTEQYAKLQFAHQLHDAFTSLSLDGAAPQSIVETAAGFCRATVVLEDLARRVIAYAPYGEPPAQAIADWAVRSRRATADAPAEWLTTPVGLREEHWARLVVPAPPLHGAEERERLATVLERASQALELFRMTDRDRISLHHQAQGGFLLQLGEHRLHDEAEALARAAALGLAPGGSYLAVAARIEEQPLADPVAVSRRGRELLDRMTDAVRSTGLDALVGPLGPQEAGLLLSLRDSDGHDDTLDRLAEALDTTGAGSDRLTLGVGCSSTSVTGTTPSIQQARHVASVAAAMSGPRLPYYRSTDLRLRGLVASMRDDPRVQAFVESELNQLVRHDARHDDSLVALLQQYVHCGGNKTRLARLSHRSRPALYKKLEKIERILGVDLDDPASLLSLGVALLAHDETGRKGA